MVRGRPASKTRLDADDVCEPIRAYLEENDIEYFETKIGCSVGIHSGNHVSGVFFVGKNN